MSASSPSELLREALTLHRRGATAQATAVYAEVLRADPANADAHCYLAMISCQQGQFADGAEHARNALAADPKHIRAHVVLGRALIALGQHADALASFAHAVTLAPDLAEAHSHYADLLNELGRHAEAIDRYDRALTLAPDCAEDWSNRGLALVAVGRHGDAIASFDRAIAGKPDLTQAHLARARVLADLGRHDTALATLDKLLAAAPDLADAQFARGNVLTAMGRNAEALAAFDRGLALRPDLAEAWFLRGTALSRLLRFEDAFVAFDKAVTLQPDLAYAAGYRLHTKLLLCDWRNLQAEKAQLFSLVREEKPASAPFFFLALSSSPADQLQCARRYLQDQPQFSPLWRGEIYSHDRIRIAYLSPAFHEHAMAYLTAGLFEQHDKSRFEVFGISSGPDNNSPIRQRIKQAFEHFVDVHGKSNQEIAQLLRRREIDTAIDIAGFTDPDQISVLARRPAPIQVNYLGYPGTMGADSFDYLLADATVIPEDHRAFYAEQVVWLPDCYQVTDNRRPISERTPTRRECGLPDAAFVFCCFNNAYKITPDIFDVWMRLLGAVDNSVLWLLERHATASEKLRREAAKRGVAAQRLIFAPTMIQADHLARHRQADLFLDNLPYNAHTGTSDALWAGLPVLTCLGTAFPGRVAASLLKAVGLDELITHSLQDYEALALKLARDPALLTSLKERLARNRNTFPLFDTERTTRQIEAAYTMMWERYRKGEMSRIRPMN